MNNFQAALLAAMVCTGPAKAQAQAQAHEVVGRTGWIYVNSSGPNCTTPPPRLLDSPSIIRGTPIPWPEGKSRFTVLKDEGLSYRIEFEDGQQAFVENWVLDRIPRKVEPGLLSSFCVGFIEPAERAKVIADLKRAALDLQRSGEELRRKAGQEREALAKKPDAQVGMTSKQVIETTNWGRPETVNRTTTATGSSEQWVYPFGYLYFQNGRLTAIQTRE